MRYEPINPRLESAAQRKLCPEHFVFAENQKENADANPQRSKYSFIALSRKTGGSQFG
jgi:hypothetical protein